MMSNGDLVDTRYWGLGTNKNPIFKAAVDALIDAKLYTSALYDPTSEALIHIQSYTNGNGTTSAAVALDVIVDAVTRAVLKGLRDGFTQDDIPKDAATNINFSSTIGAGTLNIPACKNVREAIDTLAIEVTAIKTMLSTLSSGSFLITPNPASTSVAATTIPKKLDLG